MEQTISSVQPEEQTMGGASKVLNIFFEPKRVFESLKIKPTWLVPFIIVALLGMGSFYFTFPYLMDQQVERIMENERIPEQQKERIVEQIKEKAHPPLWQMAIAPAGTLVALVVVTAVLFLVFNVLLGGDSSLAVLLSPDSKGTFVHSVLSGFDIFTIWQVILVSLGLGVMYKYSTQKALTAVVILWIIWIFAKSGLSSIFGGVFGF
jgi:hypothetical protein